MKKSTLIILSLAHFLMAEERTPTTYENYTPQTFFDRSDGESFFSKENEELLKKIIVNGHEYFMEQDGDLLDEDVATIEATPLGLKGESFSFGKSKRLLATKIYPSHQKAFYSDCDYIIKEKKLIPLPETCGFHYRKNKNRSERIEWEHIVPAWHFGHQLHCWQNGGRMTCRQTNTKFRKMEADMHNLVPAIGEINGDRSNFKYGMIEGESRLYGKVNMEIKFSDRKAEPQESIFGDIARTYFYMRDEYGMRLSNSQEKMFIAWNNLDPVSEWEKEKNQQIKELQGTENLYITNYRKIEQLGTITKESSTDYNKLKNELSEKYSFILDKLSAPVGEFLLMLITIFVIYRRKQSKISQKNPQPEKEEVKQEEKIEIKTEEEIESKAFMLITKLTDSAISINDEDEIIIEQIDRNNLNQQWIFNKANKRKEEFFIENLSTGKVIEIADHNSNDGAKIVLSKKKRRNNDHQEWRFELANDENYVFIINKWALNLLDVKNKEIEDGTKLQSFHKKIRGTENQEWKIEEI